MCGGLTPCGGFVVFVEKNGGEKLPGSSLSPRLDFEYKCYSYNIQINTVTLQHALYNITKIAYLFRRQSKVNYE